MLKIFEAFVGIGSVRIALDNLNIPYKSVGISEVDKWAIQAYDAIHNEQIKLTDVSKEKMLNEINNKHIAYNFSTYKSEIPKNLNDLKRLYDAHIRSKNYGDITLINPKELPDFDLFTFSPPCKNISIAGRQEGFDKNSDTQSALIWHCEKIIREKRPKYLIFENVKNIVGKNHIGNFLEWCKILEGYGYVNHWKILNASNFGLPQNRERCIMFSCLKEYDDGEELPEGNNKKMVLNSILDNPEDKYIINIYDSKDKLKLDLCEPINRNISILNDGNEYGRLIQLGMINKKGNQSTRRVYASNGLCPTLNSMNGGNRQPKVVMFYDDKYVIKKMSPIECWRAQGLKDELFYKAKNIGKLSDSKLYERSGRTIPIAMLEEVLKKYLIK